MIKQPRLFMVLIGATSPGRNTEQHDVFFGIANSLKELAPQIIAYWPGSKLHLDGWREVKIVDHYEISIIDRPTLSPQNNQPQLFFFNLGGYKPNEFEEYHYKILVAAPDKSTAIQQAKKTAFYKHTGFKGAPSHFDEKFGVDVDDVHKISDILPLRTKEQFSIQLLPSVTDMKDEIHLGYFKLDKL